MKTRIVFLVLFFGWLSLRAPAVDQNHNSMSDIWEMIYGASALAPGSDADGDGFTNAQEAKAGTNPFDSNSFPLLQPGPFAASIPQFTWDSFPGKRYTIQSRMNLTSGAWTNEAQLIASGSLSQTNLP